MNQLIYMLVETNLEKDRKLCFIKLRQHYTPISWENSRTLTAPSTGEDVEPQELAAGGNVKRCGRFARQRGSYSQSCTRLMIHPRNRAPEYSPNELETSVHTKPCSAINLYGSFVYNCQQLVAANISFHR